ncbi:unnamed protein product [Brassicogethes aeneus]|uniref:Uncharacterized protein n=1 Tax=Brassicogethes aeneus TaxID=1431903 RepID=A0A9P0AYK8_BRAAE|nr:unnamed protein product [Brassicogethes aeneus]
MVMNYASNVKSTDISERSQLKHDKNFNHRFSLAMDEWTSSRNRSFINLNVHTFAEGRPIFWNLGLTRIIGTRHFRCDLQKTAKSVVLNTEESETHMDAMDSKSSEDEGDDETNAGFVVKLTTSEEAEISLENGDLIRKI